MKCFALILVFYLNGCGVRNGRRDSTSGPVTIPVHLVASEMGSFKNLVNAYCRRVFRIHYDMAKNLDPSIHLIKTELSNTETPSVFLDIIGKLTMELQSKLEISPNYSDLSPQIFSENLIKFLSICRYLRIAHEHKFTLRGRELRIRDALSLLTELKDSVSGVGKFFGTYLNLFKTYQKLGETEANCYEHSLVIIEGFLLMPTVTNSFPGPDRHRLYMSVYNNAVIVGTHPSTHPQTRIRSILDKLLRLAQILAHTERYEDRNRQAQELLHSLQSVIEPIS
jgi:hypothetical protein